MLSLADQDSVLVNLARLQAILDILASESTPTLSPNVTKHLNNAAYKIAYRVDHDIMGPPQETEG